MGRGPDLAWFAPDPRRSGNDARYPDEARRPAQPVIPARVALDAMQDDDLAPSPAASPVQTATCKG